MPCTTDSLYRYPSERALARIHASFNSMPRVLAPRARACRRLRGPTPRAGAGGGGATVSRAGACMFLATLVPSRGALFLGLTVGPLVLSADLGATLDAASAPPRRAEPRLFMSSEAPSIT